MFIVTDEEFDLICQQAFDSIPERFTRDIENVAFLVEDVPRAHHLERLEDGTSIASPDNPSGHKLLLGLYSGVALTDRDGGYGLGNTPDRITLFKEPHEDVCDSAEELQEMVRRTMVHEIGHYFGMDEDQLRDMGYGSA
ncbi:MAG: metallopeptidase family protein [Coriobacteriia bacterium]|nr:metallopeptidase family protein [Coriobacteriia bacterium]